MATVLAHGLMRDGDGRLEGDLRRLMAKDEPAAYDPVIAQIDADAAAGMDPFAEANRLRSD